METHKNPQETQSSVQSNQPPPWFKKPNPAWVNPIHAHMFSH